MKEKTSGFTLVELLVVVSIFAIVLLGMIQLFIYSSAQAEMAANKTRAVTEAQIKIEEIRNYSYSAIAADYAGGGSPGNKFDLSLLTGNGIIYIDSSNAELLTIDIAICWRNKFNRVIGEDQNLNGVLDSGEDLDGDGRITSPVTLATMITRR